MSSLDVDIKLDVKDVKKAFLYLENKAIDQAAARSINRTAMKVRSISRRIIGKKIGLQQKVFKKQVDIIRKANKNKLLAVVEARGKHINLIEFVTPSKRKPGAFKKQAGVKVKQYGKQVVVKGSFIGRGKNSGKVLVFQRSDMDNNASSVQGKYGPSVPKTFINKEILKTIRKVAGETWQKEFAHNIKYYIERMK